MTPLYAAEHAISHQAFESVIFLPASWLSEGHAGSFRKWVKKSRVTDLILEDRHYKVKGNGMWSCLITREISPTMDIVRVADEGSITSFQIEKSHLPVEDGWNLEDPSEKRILESLMNDSLPFSDYCLGALYHPGEIHSEIQDGIWISIKASGNHIRFTSGKERDADADIIVKGPDPYLEGILSSSLIRWYWKFITRTQNSLRPGGAIAQIPIHQPDWFHEEEKESVQHIIVYIHERTFLLQKMRYARTYHDKTRIQREISLIEVKLNVEVCSLYRIPKPLCERLL